MKTLKFLLAFLTFAAVMISCKNEAKTEAPTVAEVEATQPESIPETATAKAEFTIEGMSCPMGCAKKIEHELASMDGVKSAQVDFDRKLAMVEYEDGKLTTDSFIETVKKAGETYSVTEMKTVESFTANAAKHECNESCKKDGCPAEMKKACGDNCTKPCCAKKA